MTKHTTMTQGRKKLPGSLQIAADLLEEARIKSQAVPQSTVTGCCSTLEEAYKVQSLGIAARQRRGEQVTGLKMGFTSRAKMAQMGVDDLICGYLTDAMWCVPGGIIDLNRFIHPRVEPEVAFLLKNPLSEIVDMATAEAAVNAVAPALEIIDSRYCDFKFSLESVVADNSSAAAFTIGAWQPMPLNISTIMMTMSSNGNEIAKGISGNILGNPLQSLIEAARLVDNLGFTLPPGGIVLAGAATPATPLVGNANISLDAGILGTVSLQIRK